MINKVILLLALISSLLTFAQNEISKDMIHLDELKDKELYSLQNKGWALLQTNEGETHLANLSNKDYIFYLSLNCIDRSQKPDYLIEYNNNYGDGDWAGLDFSSSAAEIGKKVKFAIDQKEFENPFEKNQTNSFEKFKNGLKKGKTLSLKFYNEEFDPTTGKDQFRLNRELIFKLENNYLLDVPTDCTDQDTSEVPTTDVAEAAQ